MKKLRMNLKDNSYDILIEEGILNNLNELVKEVYSNKKVYIITDSNVGPLYLEKIKSLLIDFEVESITVKAGEASKSFDIYMEVMKKLIDLNIRRNELLIALGGGVVGDLTGFIASTIYRGIPYLSIPTSLLSQMDSSIGGKTGIDFYERKNIVGAFKQPIRVIIDPATLNNLPQEEFKSGMGELIKHACIGNVALLEKLKKHPKIDEEIIEQSLIVKKTVVEVDPFDQKERMYLNFGHTFGHIIEMEKGLRHGEAVALGMLMAIKFGIDLGLTKENCYKDLKDILDGYGMLSYDIDYKKYLHDTIYDKKNLAGKLNFILIEDFGKVFTKTFREDDIINECKN